MTLEKVQRDLEEAKAKVQAWTQTVELLKAQLLKMETCDHLWERDTEILAENNGRDLSYFDSRCIKCGILKSETF